MTRLKPWHWVLIILGIAGVIAGIGFIPIERTEELSYTTWGDKASIFWTMDAWGQYPNLERAVTVTNTDSEGGLFLFRWCGHSGDHSDCGEQAIYLEPGGSYEFDPSIEGEIGDSMVIDSFEVIPPTKSETERLFWR